MAVPFLPTDRATQNLPQQKWMDVWFASRGTDTYDRMLAERAMRGQGITPGGQPMGQTPALIPNPQDPNSWRKNPQVSAAFIKVEGSPDAGEIPLLGSEFNRYTRANPKFERATIWNEQEQKYQDVTRQLPPEWRPMTLLEKQIARGEDPNRPDPFGGRTKAQVDALNMGATPADVNKPATFTFDWATASPFYKKPSDEIYRQPAVQVQELPAQSYGDPAKNLPPSPGPIGLRRGSPESTAQQTVLKELPKPGESETPTQQLNSYWSSYTPTVRRRPSKRFDYRFGMV